MANLRKEEQSLDFSEAVDMLNDLYADETDELEEAAKQNNWSSDRAKRALIKKYNDAKNSNITRGQCVLHHLNGNHNDDTNLKNDLLIVGKDRATAEMAHKLIHLLSYCYIATELTNKLHELDVDFFYFPDDRREPVAMNEHNIFSAIAAHNKQLKDLEIVPDRDDFDAAILHTPGDNFGRDHFYRPDDPSPEDLQKANNGILKGTGALSVNKTIRNK